MWGPAIPIIKLEELSFSWAASQEPLLDIDYLAIESGEKVFIEGPSGSGKSTLLNRKVTVGLTPLSSVLSVLHHLLFMP